MKLSQGQRLKIQRLARSGNVDWDAIGREIGCSAKEASDSAQKLYSPKLHRLVPKPKKPSQFSIKYGDPIGRQAVGLTGKNSMARAPVRVLEERDRRMAACQPTFGDPPIGYSALDKR